jgi:peptide/nickel transport system permease protein
VTANAVAIAGPASWVNEARSRRFGPGLALAWLVVAVIAVAVLFPGLLAPADPNGVHLTQVLEGPSGAHWFGTDQLGRDLYTRVVYGARISVFVGLGATFGALAIGIPAGFLAAIGGRIVDEVIMRITDVFLAFPGILLAMLIIAMLGPGAVNTAVAVALSAAPGFARLVRGQALAIRNADYVRTVVTFGQRRTRAYLRHLLPNALPPVMVLATLNFGASVLAGASLSFLGLGAAPPAPEWGAMLAQGQDYIAVSWAVAVFPGLAIAVTLVAIYVIGRDLQRRLAGRRGIDQR